VAGDASLVARPERVGKSAQRYQRMRGCGAVRLRGDGAVCDWRRVRVMREENMFAS